MRLSLDAFKEKAKNIEEKEVLNTVKGGNTGWEDCHGCPTLEDKIKDAIEEALQEQGN